MSVRPVSRLLLPFSGLLLALSLASCSGTSGATAANPMAGDTSSKTMAESSATAPAAANRPTNGPGEAVPDEGRDHVQEGTQITYQHYPPASGPHYPRWARYGVYEDRIPEGYWVHNLEHGAIVVLYKCSDDCAAKAGPIQDLYQQLPKGKYGEVKFVATPYDRMPNTYAVVAWDRIDQFDQWDPDRVTRFYQAYVDKGPEDVP